MTTKIGLKTAIIWARVSTPGQGETSLPTQIDHCQQLLKSKGYIATKIISVDYCSLDLYACPEFQQLQSMITNKEIQAVCIYDRDRVEAKGLQRLLFIEDLKRAGVELLICYGPPIMDGPEGQAIEIMLAAGKERSVIRARTGSRDGLRARVTLKNKPAHHQEIFGYDWDTATETLTPNDDWPTVKLIFDLALAGAGYMKICQALQKKGLVSPRGCTWAKPNVSNIIHNTVYAGRYMGLRSSIVRSDKPGYKIQHRPESDWHWIKEVKIVDPLISWEQRTMLLEQIQRHIVLSKRHANRDYLLRGMIYCHQHVGVKGNFIKYHGRPLKDSYGYCCPGDNRQHNFINGPVIEREIKTKIRNLFERSAPKFWERITQLEKTNKPQLETDLKKQTAQLSKVLQRQAQLEERRMEGLDAAVYDLLYTKFHTQRIAIEAGIKETQSQIASAENAREKAASFEIIKQNFIDILHDYIIGPDGTVDDIMFDTHPDYNVRWRQLLEALDLKVHMGVVLEEETEDHVRERLKDKKPIAPGEWDESNYTKFWDESDADYEQFINFPPYAQFVYFTIRGGLTIPPKQINDIALAKRSYILP